MKFVGPLLLVLLPTLTGCAAFENQCNQYSETDDQIACLDTAFLALESEIVESRGERNPEREGADLREYLEYCEGLRERFGDQDWAEENREDYGERLRECTAVWERLGDDRAREDCNEDEDLIRWAEDEPEAWGEDEDEAREADCKRGDLGEIRGMRDRARESVRRSADSEERAETIRGALREGRRWVDRLFGLRDRGGVRLDRGMERTR